MLAIRLQRTGRKGHAQFRLIVQEARRSPVSGNVVASLGNYDPHSKTAQVDKEKAAFYLEHGAQPSPRAALLLKTEGVKLPKWVKTDHSKQRAIKNVEKLRRNRPAVAEPKAEQPAPAEEAPAAESEAPLTEKPETAESPASEQSGASENTTEKNTDTSSDQTENETSSETEKNENSEAPEPDIEKVAEETGDDKPIEPKPEAEA